MPRAIPVFRVFVSSTFGDLKGERNALDKRVFPKLRDLCASHGAEFQAIDLRWGISAEASVDQRIVEICLSEVDRCRQATRRPNFLLLLGDRYGKSLLPPALDAEPFRRLLTRLTQDDAKRANHWYKEDANAVPVVFVLQPRRGRYREGKAWRVEQDKLQVALLRAAEHLAEAAVLELLGTSITEQETARGIPVGGPDIPGAVFVFRRMLEGLPQNTSAGNYRDLVEGEERLDTQAADSLRRFHDDVYRRLDGCQAVTEYRAVWDAMAGGPTTEHTDQLCRDVYDALAGAITEELRLVAQVDSHQSEEQTHHDFGAERRRSFTGRRDELDAISRYLRSDTARPLLVIGDPGIGKTALLAEAAYRAGAQAGGRPVIARFIGATPRSADPRTLVDDLRRSLPGLAGRVEDTPPVGLPALAEAFRDALAAVPPRSGLVLVLDALDQLAGAPDLSWLPSELPSGVRVVLSAQRGSAAEHAAAELRAITVHLGALPAGEGDELLSRWLGEAGRALTEDQRKEVTSPFAEYGNPLHLRLAFEEARRWASYTHVPPGTLASDVPGILRQLLDRLESEHGPALVRRALGLLAASRDGLSEGEMLDLLSGDGAVLGEVGRRMPKSPPTEGRLPPILWARLHADLEPYLNERRSEGRVLLGFYHRQLTEAVTARYMSGEDAAGMHRYLAEYFAAQPLDLVDGARSVANTRKLHELSYQQAYGGCWDDLYATLTDFRFLQRKIEAIGVEEHTGQQGHVDVTHTGVYALQDDFQLALRLWPEKETM